MTLDLGLRLKIRNYVRRQPIIGINFLHFGLMDLHQRKLVDVETKLVANTKHSDEGYKTMTTKKEAWSTTIHDLLKKYVDLSVPSDIREVMVYDIYQNIKPRTFSRVKGTTPRARFDLSANMQSVGKSAVFCPTENWPMEAMRRLLTFG